MPAEDDAEPLLASTPRSFRRRSCPRQIVGARSRPNLGDRREYAGRTSRPPPDFETTISRQRFRDNGFETTISKPRTAPSDEGPATPWPPAHRHGEFCPDTTGACCTAPSPYPGPPQPSWKETLPPILSTSTAGAAPHPGVVQSRCPAAVNPPWARPLRVHIHAWGARDR